MEGTIISIEEISCALLQVIACVPVAALICSFHLSILAFLCFVLFVEVNLPPKLDKMELGHYQDLTAFPHSYTCIHTLTHLFTLRHIQHLLTKVLTLAIFDFHLMISPSALTAK